MVECPICGKEVNTTQGLRGHMTFKHGELGSSKASVSHFVTHQQLERALKTKLPPEVLPMTVNLNMKTLMFYHEALKKQSDLTLSDFLDDCVEDFFESRGLEINFKEITK